MEERIYLDLNYIPQYEGSSLKKFRPQERHTNRMCQRNILILVFRGILRFEEDGIPVELKAGNYYIQTNGKMQTGLAPSEEPEYYYINFSGQFTSKRDRSLPLQGTFHMDKIHDICMNLYKEESLSKELNTNTSPFQKQILFFDILNLLYNRNISFVQKQIQATEISKYLIEHFSEDLTLQQLSDHFSYSKDHIIRIFRSHYKTTPYKYLNQYRICYAKLLLSTTDMTVASIATACGYNDISTFYYAFTKAVHVSPGEYKQNYSDMREESPLHS